MSIFKMAYIVLLACSFKFGIAQNNPIGTFCKSENFAGICLQLKADSTYSYEESTDMQTLSSAGKWIILNDTLVLNSFIQKNDIPISVKEITTHTTDQRISFPIVTNLHGDLLKDATIYINYDTGKFCMPAFENDCRFNKSSIKSFRIGLSNDIYSSWYNLNSVNCDTIKIVVDTEDDLSKNIYMTNKKFLFSHSSIIPLLSINSGENIGFKQSPYILTRIRK